MSRPSHESSLERSGCQMADALVLPRDAQAALSKAFAGARADASAAQRFLGVCAALVHLETHEDEPTPIAVQRKHLEALGKAAAVLARALGDLPADVSGDIGCALTVAAMPRANTISADAKRWLQVAERESAEDALSCLYALAQTVQTIAVQASAQLPTAPRGQTAAQARGRQLVERVLIAYRDEFGQLPPKGARWIGGFVGVLLTQSGGECSPNQVGHLLSTMRSKGSG